MSQGEKKMGKKISWRERDKKKMSQREIGKG